MELDLNGIDTVIADTLSHVEKAIVHSLWKIVYLLALSVQTLPV